MSVSTSLSTISFAHFSICVKKNEKCYPQSAVYKFQKKGLKSSIHLHIFANYIYNVVL